MSERHRAPTPLDRAPADARRARCAAATRPNAGSGASACRGRPVGAVPAFLLYDHGARRASAASPSTKPRCRSISPRPTCSSTPRRCAGPTRTQTVAGAGPRGRDLEGRDGRLRPGARATCSAMRRRPSLRDAIVAQSRHPQRPARRSGCRSPARSTSPPSTRATPRAEQLVSALEQQHALRRTFNATFLTASDATDPSAVGVWGALKGSLLHDPGDDAARLPDRRARRGLSRGIRAAEPLDRR